MKVVVWLKDEDGEDDPRHFEAPAGFALPFRLGESIQTREGARFLVSEVVHSLGGDEYEVNIYTERR